MRSIEQSLSASASEPVRAVVARSFDTSTHSLPIYTFDLEIDEGSRCESPVSFRVILVVYVARWYQKISSFRQLASLHIKPRRSFGSAPT
eukprot:5873734-Pleurochrysis_carterae.AAC.1